MLNTVDQLKKIAKEYEAAGQKKMKVNPPKFDSEVLFGYSNEERMAKFEPLIQQYANDIQEQKLKAEKCIKGAKDP